MLTLHHLEYSQSFRVLWLLEELGIEYELKLYNRDANTSLAPDEYKAISPLGTAPVITDGEVTLSETSAILDYIIDQHPSAQFRPEADAPNRQKYLFWFHASQGSLMPVGLMATLFRIMETRVPFFLKPFVKMISSGVNDGFVNPRLSAILKQAEQDLAGQSYFAGDDPTLADILLSYPMDAMGERGELVNYPHCQNWLARIKARDAYKKAVEKDGRDSVIFTV